ncbi:MAG: response regulator transcription factor [Phaeodactylibacter sp.]|uniref:response regulator transcription factor n=1 Tax=Phaeodactylibacter sp. TaxID=1940289 RepID=UPI0032EFD427
MIRVLIVDDHQLVVDGLKLTLAQADDLECAGTANDGKEALKLLEQVEADVVLLDINMEGMNGLETCRALHHRFPALAVLALSTLKEASMVKAMLREGAAGYLLKSADTQELLKAIRKVGAGQRYYSPEVAEAVMDSLSAAPSKEAHPVLPVLTRRERQVLQLIIHEYTTAEIAEELSIKFATVETHRRNLLVKLGARNTAGLVRIGLAYGLVEG